MKKLRFSGRAAIICSLILAIGVPSVAMGFGEGRNMLLGKRNPSNNPSLALSTETEIIANNSTYGTRQSNKKDGDGGGAIYGCRSNTGNEPCVKANNLKGGRAFEFNHGRPRGRPHRDRRHHRRPVHHQRHGRRHRPQRRPRRRQGGVGPRRRRDVTGKKAADFAAASDVTALAGSLLFAAVSADGTLGASRPATGVTARKVARRATPTPSTSARTSASARSRLRRSAPPPPRPRPSRPRRATPTPSTSTPAPPPASFHLQVIC